MLDVRCWILRFRSVYAGIERFSLVFENVGFENVGFRGILSFWGVFGGASGAQRGKNYPFRRDPINTSLPLLTRKMTVILPPAFR